MIGKLLRRAARRSGYGAVREFLRPPGFEGSKLTFKRMRNLYLGRWEQQRGKTKLRSYPIKLIVDPTNVCNLRCPACFTGAGEVGRVRSAMSPELFNGLIGELGDYLFLVDFGSWGEPLLCKNVESMIEAASRRGIATVLSTNFSIPFDAARAERLVASGLTVLGVSIDGAKQETYEKYRVRGDLETVLANCRLMVEAKRRLGARYPKVVWAFHVFEHNAGDVGAAVELAREVGIDIDVTKGWVIGDEWNPEGEYRFYQDPSPGRCMYLWQIATVNNDGGVAPCCATFYREDDMGVLAAGRAAPGARNFREVWNGPSFQRARAFYAERHRTPETEQSICFDCPQTVLWERWKRHLAAGGTPETFRAGYSTNDSFNYFFRRRPRRSTDTDEPARRRAGAR